MHLLALVEIEVGIIYGCNVCLDHSLDNEKIKHPSKAGKLMVYNKVLRWASNKSKYKAGPGTSWPISKSMPASTVVLASVSFDNSLLNLAAMSHQCVKLSVLSLEWLADIWA